MLTRHRLARTATAAAVCAGLAFSGAALSSAAAVTPQTVTAQAVTSQAARDAIMGTWVGPVLRIEAGKRLKGIERFVITHSWRSSAKGTWQFKLDGSTSWSKALPLQFVVRPAADGSWVVTGADVNGIYFGTMNAAGTVLDLSYQGSVNALVTLHFTMRKR